MSESKGVRRVDGSEPEAVAYRINPSIHLRRSMRYSTWLSSEEGKFEPIKSVLRVPVFMMPRTHILTEHNRSPSGSCLAC